MKKSKLIASIALAGMIVGTQVALADHHEKTKEENGKNSCKGKKDSKDKNSCKGKKAEGTNACSGMNGCDGKDVHPAAPAKPNP